MIYAGLAGVFLLVLVIAAVLYVGRGLKGRWD